MSLFSDLENKLTSLVNSVTPADQQTQVHQNLSNVAQGLNSLLVVLENIAEEELNKLIAARLGPMAADLEHALLESLIKKAQERQTALLTGGPGNVVALNPGSLQVANGLAVAQ